jgi:hypothetical protein
MLWNNYQYNTSHSNTTTEGILYFDAPISSIFYVGQLVTISSNGNPHDGVKTLTGVNDYSITYAVSGSPTAAVQHAAVPYGRVAGTTSATWSSDAAVLEAALSIAVDIWQARQTTSSGGVAVDFQPSPWKMGSSLLARVRGLIAHALDPRSMVG